MEMMGASCRATNAPNGADKKRLSAGKKVSQKKPFSPDAIMRAVRVCVLSGLVPLPCFAHIFRILFIIRLPHCLRTFVRPKWVFRRAKERQKLAPSPWLTTMIGRPTAVWLCSPVVGPTLLRS